MRPQIACAAGALIVLCLGISVARSAQGNEEVTITLKDGKTEKGELLKYDRLNLDLRYHVGQNHLDVKIPWSKVKTVSNGLTLETVQRKWMEENKDRLCDACKGAGTIPCTKCGGVGQMPKAMVPCNPCEGKGTVPCTAKGCTNGKIDCQGKCLKLSEGKWEKHDDGLRWRRFTYGGAYQEWSEHHLGEVIEVQDGKPVNLGKCPLCDGTTKVNCTACKGTGSSACPACKGEKQVPAAGPAPKCDSCEGGVLKCPDCKGTGLKP